MEPLDAPSVKLGLLRLTFLAEPLNLQIKHNQITTAYVNAVHCSAYIFYASIKGLYSLINKENFLSDISL
jgi:hypothetical protein